MLVQGRCLALLYLLVMLNFVSDSYRHRSHLVEVFHDLRDLRCRVYHHLLLVFSRDEEQVFGRDRRHFWG